MQITSLILSLIILVILLAILMFFLFKAKKRKKELLQKNSSKKKKRTSLDSLRDRLKDKTLSTEDLKNTLDTVIQEYGVIKDFDIYIDIILRMTRHPQTNKNIIIGFEKELSELNPKLATAIASSVTNGLNSR